MPIPAGYTSGQIVQAVPTGINSAFVYLAGASFTAQSTVGMPAGTFTSTYKNYQVELVVTSVSVVPSDLDIIRYLAGLLLSSVILTVVMGRYYMGPVRRYCIRTLLHLEHFW